MPDPLTGLPQPGQDPAQNQPIQPGQQGVQPNPMSAFINRILQELMRSNYNNPSGMPGTGGTSMGPGQSPWPTDKAPYTNPAAPQRLPGQTDLPGRGQTAGYGMAPAGGGLPQPRAQWNMMIPDPKGPPPPGNQSWDDFRLDHDKELKQWREWVQGGRKGPNPLQQFYPEGQKAPESHIPQQGGA